MQVELKPFERIDELRQGGYRLIQSPKVFCFGTDSVLLADFANPRPKDIAVDLGCGTGAIALLMKMHQPSLTVDGVELQSDVADMAARSVMLNGLEDSVHIYNEDMRTFWRIAGAEKRTLVVCNPPYGRNGAALLSEDDPHRIARHEGELTLDELCLSASKLLKTGGRFCVIFPAPRAFEMMRAMQASRMAPKRIRTVQGKAGRPPKFVLMDAVKGGGEGLDWLPPLVLQNADDSYTEEWRRIYRETEETASAAKA